MTNPTLVHVGGRYRLARQVRVPLLERGFLFGDGVFETIRTFGRRPFRLASHFARLRRSADALEIPLPLEEPRFRRIVSGGIERVPGGEVYVRALLTRGVSPLAYQLPEEPAPRLYTFFDPLPPPSPDLLERGVRVVTWHEEKAGRFAQVKLMNSVPAILARHEARKRGAYEVLRLDQRSHLIEGYISNVFVVRSGVLHTPPATLGLLDGVTRNVILELAAARGVPVEESLLTVEDAGLADEVFLSHSSVGVVPVVEIDQTRVAGGRVGELTRSFALWFATLADHPERMEGNVS